MAPIPEVRPLKRVREWFLSFPTDKQQKVILAALLLIAIWRLWLIPMRSSFWLDETGTVWAASGTFRNVFDRAWMNPGQPSVLYTLIAWLALSRGSWMEFTLRLPSILAMTGALLLLYKLAVRVGLKNEALIALGIFATNELVRFAASDARPYAMALLCVVATMLMLVKWLDAARKADAIGFALFCALSIYLHYLCALMLPVYAVYAGNELRSKSSIQRGTLIAAAVLPVILCLPLAPHAAHLWSFRGPHSFARIPDFRDFGNVILPSTLLLAAIVAMIAARLASNEFTWRDLSGRHKISLGLWYTLPIAICFLMARASNARLFVGRYYLWAMPAMALLLASLIAGIEPMRARRFAGIVIVALLTIVNIRDAQPLHGNEDWRGAIQQMNSMAEPDTPVLVQTGFTESASMFREQLSDLDGALFAPFAAYPLAGHAIGIPSDFSESTIQRLDRIVGDSLLARPNFFVLTRGNGRFETWLQGRLLTRGYLARPLGNFISVHAVVFERGGERVAGQ